MDKIINYHVIDPENIGDLLSSPLLYFEMPGYQVESADIRTVDVNQSAGHHLILGGGGLLFPRFFEAIAQLLEVKGAGKIAAWGVGQQIYGKSGIQQREQADYARYLEGFDLVGIRDYGTPYPWVPCASCMHTAFDRPWEIQHEFVVFSHKKFELHLAGFPRMTNDAAGLDEVLDFLGSGETVLTSSFHGAYWASLLGRKVLAFPFSSKFYTLKHQPAIYPVQTWRQQRWSLRLFNKVIYELRYKNRYTCSIDGWQTALQTCQTYSTSLQECRERNQWFHAQVMTALAD